MRSPSLVVASVTVVAAAACAAGSVRPSFEPYPQALVDTLRTDPPDAVQELVSLLVAEGMQIQFSSPKEGYLETMYFNVVTRQSVSASRETPEQAVLIRIWADPIQPGMSKVTGEVVYRRTIDPSVMKRDAETHVRPGHPGEGILQRALQAARERFGK